MSLFRESGFYGDTSEDSLDEEYRQILFLIKPYILKVTDRVHIRQYQLWLHRLSESSAKEKFERNKYLLELANQIQDGTLKPPFTLSPPLGPLSTLRKKAQSYNKAAGEQEWPTKRSVSSTSTKNLSKHQLRQSRPEHIHSAGQNKPKLEQQPQKRKVPLKTFQKIGRTPPHSGGESSSWCDLTDEGEESPSNNFDSGDIIQQESNAMNDVKVASKINYLHTSEGQKLKQHYMKKYEEGVGKKNTNQPIATNKNVTDNEVNALKQRIKDLIEVKNALKDTHFLTEDRKKIMDTLQTKLIETEEINAELRKTIDSQNRKIQEMEKTQSKVTTELKENFTSLRNRELDILKAKFKEDMDSKDKFYQSELEEIKIELQKQIDDLMMLHEREITDLKSSHAIIAKEKENEIGRLKSELKATDPEADEQIVHLKRCISKMDKMLQKSEKEYVKKIERLKQELEVKEMTNQVQLQTQRAEIMLRNSATKQEEFSNAINTLEAKYKYLLQTQLQALTGQQFNEECSGRLTEISE